MAEPFEERYPNIVAWVRDGWIELGRDDYGRSFVRVLDIGGMVWEGKEDYEQTDSLIHLRMAVTPLAGDDLLTLYRRGCVGCRDD